MVLLFIFFFCLFSCKLCALLVLLFDNACSIVGFSLGERLVVMLVLCFVFMGLQSEEDAGGRHGPNQTFWSIKRTKYVDFKFVGNLFNKKIGLLH